MAGYEPGAPETTLDARIGAATLQPPSPVAVIARGIHDACIDLALARTLREIGRPVVGVMGSHGTPRGAPEYRMVADLGRRLGREGLLVVTGGGPGSWRPRTLERGWPISRMLRLTEAIDVLERSPRYHDDPAAFLERARDVRARWPDGGVNLGVPTWLYVDEPSNQFVTYSAKYFQNSIRENGLLGNRARGRDLHDGWLRDRAGDLHRRRAERVHDVRRQEPDGPVGAVTTQTTTGSVSSTALRALAKRGGWEHLVRVVTDPASAVAAITDCLRPAWWTAPPPNPTGSADRPCR